MNQLKPPGRFRSMIREVATRVANRVLSAKAKRTIFIASITGMAYPLREPDSITTEKLNKVFSLVKDPNALELPMYVKSAIWRDCDLRVMAQNGQAICPASLVYGTVSEADARKLADHVVNTTPSWLHYCSPDEMRQDMSKLIQHIKSFRQEMAVA